VAEVISSAMPLVGLVLVVLLYAGSIKEGIDPNAIFTQVPPARCRRKGSSRRESGALSLLLKGACE